MIIGFVIWSMTALLFLEQNSPLFLVVILGTVFLVIGIMAAKSPHYWT